MIKWPHCLSRDWRREPRSFSADGCDWGGIEDIEERPCLQGGGMIEYLFPCDRQRSFWDGVSAISIAQEESMLAQTPVHLPFQRRPMLQAGALSLLGLGAGHLAELRGADVRRIAPGSGRAKAVVMIFLSGGLTQHDSFDPKPDAPAEIRGEFDSISTATPGVAICEHLPMLGACSHLWGQVRSLTSPHNGHSEGHMSLLSGRSMLPPGFNGSKPQSSDWPSIASVVKDAIAGRNNNLPPAVVLPERLVHREGRVIPGQFGGLMGAHRDPWFIEASPFNATSYGAYPDYEFHFVRGRERNPKLAFEAPSLSLPQGLSRQRLADRNGLRELLEVQRQSLDRAASEGAFDRSRQSALSLLTDAAVQKAFDVHAVAEEVQLRYGKNAFGWSLLMARNLVEAGVNLVQVNLGNDETWDTHDNNFPLLKDCLLPPMDQSVAAFLEDLHQSGLLQETLVVMFGEMGRTPKVQVQNRSPGAKAGRDHWGAVQTVLAAGAGVPGGVVVGASDRNGAYPAADPQRPENLAATIYSSLGIPQTAAWHDEVNRPHQIYHGEPIRFA